MHSARPFRPGRCFALMLAVGCSSQPEMISAPTGAVRSSAITSITGRVLGPDGSSICNFLVPGASTIVRAIRLVGQGSIVATQTLVCPADGFTLATDSGSFALRVQNLGAQTFAALPDRALDLGPIVVDTLADAVHDLVVPYGLVLGGGATVDGVPVANTGASLTYAQLTGFGAASGLSSVTGGWQESFGRVPLLLQDNLDYLVSGCGQRVGSRIVDTFPVGAFHFSTPVDRLDCNLVTSAAARFVHTSSGLAVGALPGDIGGLSPAVDTLGLGYGVQFPVTSPLAQAPLDLFPLQLFKGGLLLGVSPTTVLSGVDIGGYVACSAPCQDFGAGAVGTVRQVGQETRISWVYSDGASPQGIGLSVDQASVDGPPGGDYVLFRFRVTNGGPAPVTLSPGLFMDWDIDGAGAVSDVGNSDLNGQLMYVGNDDGNGRPRATALGTMIFAGNRPSPGRYFFSLFNPQLSVADLYRTITGSLQEAKIGASDIAYIQGGASLTIRPGRAEDIWVAVVAGADVSQLFAHARAATAQVAQLKRGGIPGTGPVVATYRMPSGGRAAAANPPGRKWGAAAADR